MTSHPPAMSDLVLTITLGVQSRSHGRVRNLNIVIDDRFVFIKGETASYHTKQLAQHGALDVIENRELINQIVVI